MARGDDRPWTRSAAGLSVVVRLTPKGGRDGVVQSADGRAFLKARAATGATGRIKRLVLTGDPDVPTAALERAAAKG